MKFRKAAILFLSASVAAGTLVAPAITYAETAQDAQEEDSEGDFASDSEAAKGARTAETVQNDRAYINGDEIRAYASQDGVYVVADDLVAYGFDVVTDEAGITIEWAGTDYYFDDNFTPDTDDEAMPEGEPEGEAISAVIAGEEAQAYTIDGNTVVKAEDLGRFGFVEYDEEKGVTDIYVEAAGYTQNEEEFRNIVVDAANVTGEVRAMNGAHYDPGPEGSDINSLWKEAGIISARTHDIDGTSGDGRGIIYNIVPGYFDLYSAIKFVPVFIDDLTAAAQDAGKLEGEGELEGQDWLANARLEDKEENAWTGDPADPARTDKINEILDNDAYPYAIAQLEALIADSEEALKDIDVTDEQYYDFEELDKVIDNYLSTGASVYFRFGASQNDILDNTFPELGTEEWDIYKENLAKIAVRILDHYQAGWAGGEKYDNVITWFEIWNEPDLLDFWPNEPQHYYEMYEAVTKAVKEAYPDVQVGGPTITTENDDRGIKESFLEYVVANDCPLDFYSYHFYPSNNIDGYDYTRWALHYKNLIADYGYEDIPIFLSEYGTALMSQFTGFINEEGRAKIHLLNNCIYLEDSPVVIDYSYNRITSNDNAQYVAFKTISQLYGADRLKVTGADKNGFAVIAGAVEDSIKVVISNYEIPADQMLRNFMPENQNPMMDVNKMSIPGVANWTLPVARVLTYKNNAGYNLTINNVPYTGEVTVEKYKVDTENNMDLVDTFAATVNEDGSLEISSELAVYTADLLVIKGE